MVTAGDATDSADHINLKDVRRKPRTPESPSALISNFNYLKNGAYFASSIPMNRFTIQFPSSTYHPRFPRSNDSYSVIKGKDLILE